MSSALPIPVIAPARPAHTRDQLERAFAEFLRLDVAAGDAAPATVRSYRAEVAAWVRRCETNRIDPATATVAHIKLFRAELVERGYQPVTIGWKLTVVRCFYEAGRSSGLRQDNPVAGVRPPRVRRAAEDFKYLTADQLARLLAAVPGPDEATGVEQIKRLRDRLMLSLMALHGLRTVEVHRASLEDLTERGGSTALLVRGKSGQRLLFLRPDTGEILARYLELRGEMPPDELGTPLFVALDRGFKGHRLSRRHIRAITDHYLHAAGLKRQGLSCHALRHTAATLGYLHTGDLRAVQELLGHADPRTTARYAHVVDMAKRNPALFIPVSGL